LLVIMLTTTSRPALNAAPDTTHSGRAFERWTSANAKELK
jgi:hypothetical protein